MREQFFDVRWRGNNFLPHGTTLPTLNLEKYGVFCNLGKQKSIFFALQAKIFINKQENVIQSGFQVVNNTKRSKANTILENVQFCVFCGEGTIFEGTIWENCSLLREQKNTMPHTMVLLCVLTPGKNQPFFFKSVLTPGIFSKSGKYIFSI